MEDRMPSYIKWSLILFGLLVLILIICMDAGVI